MNSSKAQIRYFIRVVKDHLSQLEHMLENDDSSLNPDKYIPLSEASKISGFSQGTLRNYCKKGKLKGRKRGKVWEILESVAYDIQSHIIRHHKQ